MSKIHISLVGGQTAPVYHGIIDSLPDQVILIHSEQSEKEALRIKNEIPIAAELCKLDPVDLQQIFSAVEKLAARFRESESITVNISSGPKPWSVAFYSVFSQMKNAVIEYIDQNNKVWSFTDRKNHSVNFDMDAQFRLYGNPLKNYKCFSDYTDADRSVVEKIREMRNFNFKDFNDLTMQMAKKPNETSQTLPSGSHLTWFTKEKEFEFVLKKKGTIKKEVLKSPQVRQLLFNTGWFEYEIALILSQWEHAKEIRLNCMFPAKNKSAKNEIDIIVDTGAKLLFVECKTQIKNITDIDKFHSAVKNYGGLGSKALFITDAVMDETAKEKCQDSSILTFSLQNKMLGVDPEKMLFMLLNSELFNINTK
ncbi:MAG: DUF6293 family protein [Prevotellaceae bacterium]|jgi:hypothetical protein|nr:DUF6293 family protein [Prevotellaceae bacterium]